MQTSTPTNLLKARYEFADPNLAKIRTDGKKPLATSPIKIGRLPVRILLQGYLTTAGINKSEHDTWGDKWSFGMQLNHQEDADALKQILEELSKCLSEWEPDTDFELKDVFKDEVLYLKAKTNPSQTGFIFTSNYKLHPKKPNVDIQRYMPLDVEAEMGAYINVKNDTAGIYFTIRHITFRQHEEDAIDVGDVEGQSERKRQTPEQQPSQETKPQAKRNRRG